MDRGPALSREHCLRLLARSNVGRVAFTEHALPAIRLVHYTMVGSSVLLRTEGGELGPRLDAQVVAFEVGELDAEAGTGWSVVLTGTAQLMREPGELMRQETDPLVPSTAGRRTKVCIVPGEVRGRQIGRAYDDAPASIPTEPATA